MSPLEGGAVARGLDLVSLAQVESRTPFLSRDDQVLLRAELNAAVRRIAPCLTTIDADEDAVAEAIGIVLRALGRQDTDAWVESVTTGKYAVRYRPGAAASGVLTAGDEAALRRLCGPTAPAGLPDGSFPAPGGHERLFRTLRAY